MLPENIPTEWVEKAARAVYESRRRAAKATSGVYGTDHWADWNPGDPDFSGLLEDQREALAVVVSLISPDIEKRNRLAASLLRTGTPANEVLRVLTGDESATVNTY